MICWRRLRNWWHHRRSATREPSAKCFAGYPLLVLPKRLAVLPRRRQYLLRRHPEGRNREHAILHADRCVAVNPSDSAPALIALDAKFVIRTRKGERIVDAEDYFIGPDIDITRLHILQPAICLQLFVFPRRGRARNFILRKFETATFGTSH